MRLENDQDESYVEDRRGQGGGGGGGGGVRMGVGGTIVVLTLSVVFGRNLFRDLAVQPGTGSSGGTTRSSPRGETRVRNEEALKRVAVSAFNDAQATWPTILRGGGPGYRPAHLVLFWDETRSG